MAKLTTLPTEIVTEHAKVTFRIQDALSSIIGAMSDDFLYDSGCTRCDGRSAKRSDGSSSNNACAQARFVALQAEVG